MIRRFVGVACLTTLAAVPTVAFAQLQTGSILVKAVDEQKSTVPGASVTLTGAVLPAALTGVTDESGVYRFPSLTVGTYTVKVALVGFKTISRENVVVVQGQTVSLDITMTVSSVAEEVTVQSETPVVDTKSAKVNVNLDSKLLETTPGGKDIWNILEYKVPGLIFDTPDVGGNQAGLQRGFTARGTPNSQNQQFLNGVNVGDPAAIGFSMNYYDPSSFQNIQVSTGAQDIALATSGVVINMVTKSGTNRYLGQALETYQGRKTQWDNITPELQSVGFRPEANAVDYITNTNFQHGGPLQRGRLFYYGAINFQPTHVNVVGFPPIPPAQIPTINVNASIQDTTDILTGSGKLTYQYNPSNRFEVYLQKQRYDKPNRDSGPTVTQDSNSKEYDIDNTVQVLWNWVLSDRMFADTNLSYNNVHFPLFQKTDLQSISDNTTGIRLRNRASSQIMFRRRLEGNSNWQYYIPRLFGGRHEIKGGFSNSFTPEDVETQRAGNVNLTFRSQQGTATQPPGPVNVTIFNSPNFVKRAVNNTALYVQDAYSRKRLTAIVGVRWERVEGFLPEQEHPSSEFFPTGTVIRNVNIGGVVQDFVVPDRFAAVDNAPLWKNWGPRASVTYDLTGRGKTVLKASVGRYLDQIGTGTPGPNPNGTIQQTYTWNDLNNDLVFQAGDAVWDGTKYVGGEFGTAQNVSVPNPNPFDQTLRRTARHEWTTGVDHELYPGFRLSATFIHKREKDPQGTVDGRLEEWDQLYSLVDVQDIGRDGLAGTEDDRILQVFSLNRLPDGTLPALATRTVNDDRLATRYNGVELTAERRYRDGWTVLGGYTYGRTEVDQTSLSNPNNAFVNAKGENGGRRHIFKVTGSYQFRYGILVGANLRAQSGLPITRGSQTFPTCSATVTTFCTNQNVSVNAEPRGSVRLPGLTTLDMRVGKIFVRGTQQIELSMDAYNVTNANTVFSVRQGTGRTTVQDFTQPGVVTRQIAQFQSPTGVLGPRILRFNITYNFGH
jgi:hypothetical protein